MTSFYRRLTRFVGSYTFFMVIMGVFAAGALWIALSSRYPMAFDESYHLGLIKLHALQWSPIFTHQPGGFAEYGALTRDPSYLFHWLMSFPYRLLQLVHASEMMTVLVLRLINIALFGTSLPLLRRLLLKTSASPAIVHATLLFFVLVPVVPLVAATINYDNLQILLLFEALLLLVRFKENLALKKFDISAITWVFVIGLLGSLVKFTFLPFLTAFAVYFLYTILRFHLRDRQALARLKRAEWRAKSRLQQIILSVTLLSSSALFISTYGVNIIEYHNPIPQCGQVLNAHVCSAYGPWYRNYMAAEHNRGVNPDPLRFSGRWVIGMFDRSFFTINGKAPVQNFQNFLAPVMSVGVIIIGVVGLVLIFIFGWHVLRRSEVLRMMFFVSFVYTVSLWGRNYHDYLHLGQMVAINGRYLVPVMLPLFLLIAESYKLALVKRAKARLVLAGAALFLILQGGGASSFIYYSSDAWYWDGNENVQAMNHTAKKIIRPLFINYYFKRLDHLYQ